jgi:hypothetical protein
LLIRPLNSQAPQPVDRNVCERCGKRSTKPRSIERHQVCATCFRWIVVETSRRLTESGRGNGLPLVELPR